jgi:hypothetical protein
VTGLIVTSVFAGSVVLTGAATALTEAVTTDSASDVQAYRTATTQTITATVTVTNGSAGNRVTFEVPAGNIVDANGVSVDNAEVSTSGLSIESSTLVTVDL